MIAKSRVKKISLYATLLVLALWALGSLWALKWTDERNPHDLPNSNELAVARFFWKWTPAFDRNKDVERALKLSWMTASKKIYRKGKRTESMVIGILNDESIFLKNYIKPNFHLLSKEKQFEVVVLVLSYLNRVNLYQNYFDPRFEKESKYVESWVNTKDSGVQSDWYLEVMIHDRLRGSDKSFEESRAKFQTSFREEGVKIGMPTSFIEGVINYYDGVLLCVVKRNEEALPYLEVSARRFAETPEYAGGFLYIGLNILFLSKGKEAGSDCHEAISKIVLFGE